MASEISVGVQSNGTVAVDLENEDNGEWAFHTLSIDEAEFLRDELTASIERARARLLKISPPPMLPPALPPEAG